MFETKLLNLSYSKEKGSTVESATIHDIFKNNHVYVPIVNSFTQNNLVLNVFRVFIVIAFLALLLRLAMIQVYSAPVWQNWSENSTRQMILMTPPRGQIYDRNGRLIATNRPKFTFITSLKNAQNPKKIPSIKELFQLSDKEFEKILKKGYAGSVKIKQDLSNEEMLKFVAQATTLGIDVVAEYDRVYVSDIVDPVQQKITNQSVSAFTGYVSYPTEDSLNNLDKNIYHPDSKVGLTGIEKVYETVLQGKPGRIERQFDLQTDTENRIVQGVESGEKIVTTIDLGVQQQLFQILSDELAKNQLSAGSAVLMNADTGEIRSMVNYPAYDPESFTNKEKQSNLAGYFSNQNRPLFNRVTKGQYPPGSSFKPFVAAIALEQEVIKPGQELYDPGVIRVESKVVQGRVDEYINFKRTFFGNIDINQALAKSSDVFFYLLTGGDPETGKVPVIGGIQTNPIGVRDLKTGLQKYFGLGMKTGIDLESENAGVMPDPEYKSSKKLGSWFLGDTYQTSIGQGFVLTTPLQLARATAVFANGGYLVQPHINTSVTPTKNHSGLSNSTLQTLNQALRDVVIDGTAKRLQDNRSVIAAKTGTAQFDPKDPDRSYGWVISYNTQKEVVNENLVLVVLTEDIRKTAESITVPATNRMWQAIEQVYTENQSR